MGMFMPHQVRLELHSSQTIIGMIFLKVTNTFGYTSDSLYLNIHFIAYLTTLI